MQLRALLPARFRKGEIVIPVVRLSGVIAPSAAPFSQSLSLASCAASLERAFETKAAPVVALVVNSPGGSPVQSRLIHARIRELARKNGKKVLVFVEDVAASGGYMIALAGDEIIADESSIIGSIGVISSGFGFTEAMTKLGVERRVHTSGQNKSILDPFQPEKPEDIVHLKELQAQIHAMFIQMVKSGRGPRLVEHKDMFTGLFWTGSRAMQMGLIDQCGLLGTVIAERYGDKAKLKLVAPRRNLLGRSQPAVNVQSLMPGMIAGLPAATLAALEERALWQRFGL